MPAASKALPATRKFPKKAPAVDAGKSPSGRIDARIAELRDWRGEMLTAIRAAVRGAIALDKPFRGSKAKRAA